MAHRVAEKLARGERSAFAGIGVRTQDALATRSEPRQGARITQIIAGGPAERAGMRRGDVIYAIDGLPVASSKDLKGMIEAREVKETLRITFGRGAADRVVQVKTLDASQIGAQHRVKAGRTKSWAGMSVVNPTQELLLNRGVALPKNVTGGALVPAIEDFYSHIIPDAWGAMRYNWTPEHGKFSFYLDRDVPYVLGIHAETPVNGLLSRNGLKRRDIDHWIIHSGGKKVIDAIKYNIGITAHDVRHTVDILRKFGNLGSGSFLFSYQRLMAEGCVEAGDRCVMMTMGPGSTIETALLHW